MDYKELRKLTHDPQSEWQLRSKKDNALVIAGLVGVALWILLILSILTQLQSI